MRQKSTQNVVPYCQKYTPTDYFFSVILPTGYWLFFPKWLQFVWIRWKHF